MGDLTPFARPDVSRIPTSLEEKLIWLTGFGKPRLTRMNEGWFAVLEMHVAAKGTTFKIDTEIHHQTPSAALDQCIARMVQTLKDLESMRG